MAFGKCRRVWRVRATRLGQCQQVWQVTTSTQNAPQTCPQVLATFAKFALAKFADEWPLLNFETNYIKNISLSNLISLQAVGHCDGSRVNTEMFRISHQTKDGSLIMTEYIYSDKNAKFLPPRN
jgi:hypothetical protein